jgi:hypothetical protein
MKSASARLRPLATRDDFTGTPHRSRVHARGQGRVHATMFSYRLGPKAASPSARPFVQPLDRTGRAPRRVAGAVRRGGFRACSSAG